MSIVTAVEKQLIHTAFRESIRPLLGAEENLEAALEYVLQNPGGLIRAQLVFRIMQVHAASLNDSLGLSMAIEYFHTASLVFDDLPCMDNGKHRRGRECVHRLFGDATAILVSLALINKAYSKAWEVLRGISPKLQQMAGEKIEECLGARGLLSGQARDLNFSEEYSALNDVIKCAMGKTTSLMRLTLLVPALVAGASERELQLLDRLAKFWGLAYQLIDDFGDRETDGKMRQPNDSRLQGGLRPNLVNLIGPFASKEMLSRLLRGLDRTILQLVELSSKWDFLKALSLYLRDNAIESCARGKFVSTGLVL